MTLSSSLSALITPLAHQQLGSARVDFEHLTEDFVSVSMLNDLASAYQENQDQARGSCELIIFHPEEIKQSIRCGAHSFNGNNISVPVLTHAPHLAIRKRFASIADDYLWCDMSGAAMQEVFARWQACSVDQLNVNTKQQTDTVHSTAFSPAIWQQIERHVEVEKSSQLCGGHHHLENTIRAFIQSGNILAAELNESWLSQDYARLKAILHKIQGLSSVIVIRSLAVPLSTSSQLAAGLSGERFFSHSIARQACESIAQQLTIAVENITILLSST